MSGMDKKLCTADLFPQSCSMKQKVQDIKEDGVSNAFRRLMLGKMPPPPSRMVRQPHGHADGDNPCEDAGLGQSVDRDGAAADKNHIKGRAVAHFQEEKSLPKFSPEDAKIAWSNYEMPAKTDLYKLLHFKISNYINPDVLVKIGNYEFRCHLLVLQCYSGYFIEQASSRIELPEQNVTKEAFTYIYDWMLHLGGNSFSLLRRDNILEIFMAAQFLQVKELEEQCWAFVDNEDLFSEDNAFLLYTDARSMGNTAIMELMVPRIQRFFLTLVSCKDFLDLVVAEVTVLLRSNYICVHCEMEVFMSAVRWLMFDWEKRQKFLVDVMSCVRFGLISPWQLVDIRRNPENQEFLLVTRNSDVSGMIEDGLAFAIIKYWYGENPTEYRHWIETLSLTVPSDRNWAGTGKISDQLKYTTYQEFLRDLAEYRETHLLSKQVTGDRECTPSEEDTRGVLELRTHPRT